MADLATPDDVADVWRPLTDTEEGRAYNLITKASALLRKACPFDLDARLALDASDPLHLDSAVVASVVATIVKRALVNPDGAVSTTETMGPFSHSTSYASRGTDPANLGELAVLPSDLERLLPTVGFSPGFTIRTRTRYCDDRAARWSPWSR